ncbi:MAG: hypothetical protein J6X45_04470 [Lachnospiraceae bacterium]|nr:hypothetical protein [Lachnospiraceae bacterium]
MSWYTTYYLGLQDKDKKIIPLGPYDNNHKLKSVISTSRSFTTDLKDLFYPIQDEMVTDELRAEFSCDIDTELRPYFEYLPLKELPTGEWVKSGYYLLSDINTYLASLRDDNTYFEDFYDSLSSTEYAMKLENELKFGKPQPYIDADGWEVKEHACSEYAYFAYPDYECQEYEASLLRTVAGMLKESYNLEDGEQIVVIKTEG